ncbi:MAG TPA: hypothetical protein VFB90_01110 [Dehalococcoidia bacterium]|nr:hypothetical protein [Dehalococcoidia bacterium]
MTYDDLRNTSGIVVEKVVGDGDATRGPRAGDVVYFRNAQGQSFITTANSDGSLADPVPGSRIAQPGRRAGAAAYPPADDIAPHAPDWAKQHYEAVRTSDGATPQDMDAALKVLQAAATADTKAGTVDAKTLALAQNAVQKRAAGRVPTQAELEAFNQVAAAGGIPGVNGSGSGIATATGSSGGFDAFAQGLLASIGAPVTDANMRLLRAWSQKEGTAAAYNPFATTLRMGGNNALAGNSAGVQNYPDLATGVQATARTLQGGYPKLVAALQASSPSAFLGATDELGKWSGGDGASYASSIANLAGEGGGSGHISTGPGSNPSFDLPSANHLSIQSFGGKLLGINPLTGEKVVIASDPASLAQQVNAAVQAIKNVSDLQQGLMPKEQQLIQDGFRSLQSIKQQLASGAITPDDADNYARSVHGYITAALSSTTPYQIWKDQMAAVQQKASLAKDLLDQRLSSTASMANTLMQAGKGLLFEPPPGANPETLARLNAEVASGGPEATDAATRAFTDYINAPTQFQPEGAPGSGLDVLNQLPASSPSNLSPLAQTLLGSVLQGAGGASGFDPQSLFQAAAAGAPDQAPDQ